VSAIEWLTLNEGPGLVIISSADKSCTACHGFGDRQVAVCAPQPRKLREPQPAMPTVPLAPPCAALDLSLAAGPPLPRRGQP
jgi:hypothetical protein